MSARDGDIPETDPKPRKARFSLRAPARSTAVAAGAKNRERIEANRKAREAEDVKNESTERYSSDPRLQGEREKDLETLKRLRKTQPLPVDRYKSQTHRDAAARNESVDHRVPRAHTKQDDREFEDAQGAHDRYWEAQRTGASTPGKERAARITKAREDREAAQHALNQDAVQKLNARSREARENKTSNRWRSVKESTADVALRIISETTEPKHRPISVSHQGVPVQGVTTTPKQSAYSMGDHEAHDVHHDGKHIGSVHSYSTSAVQKKNSVRMQDSGKTSKKWGYDFPHFSERGARHFSSKRVAVEELVGAHLRRHGGKT